MKNSRRRSFFILSFFPFFFLSRSLFFFSFDIAQYRIVMLLVKQPVCAHCTHWLVILEASLVCIIRVAIPERYVSTVSYPKSFSLCLFYTLQQGLPLKQNRSPRHSWSPFRQPYWPFVKSPSSHSHQNFLKYRFFLSQNRFDFMNKKVTNLVICMDSS